MRPAKSANPDYTVNGIGDASRNLECRRGAKGQNKGSFAHYGTLLPTSGTIILGQTERAGNDR